MIHYDLLKPLEFRANAQDANGIIQKIHKMSQKDRELLTSQSKYTGNLYVENIEKFEYFGSEAMSN
jgi:hypothetical protein